MVVDLSKIIPWLKDNIGTLSVILITGSAVLNKFTSLKIWTRLAEKMGKWMNGDVISELKKLNESVTSNDSKIDSCIVKIEDCQKKIDLDEFKRIKFELSRFKDELLEKSNYVNRERFNQMMELVDDYENHYADLHNGELKQTILYIKERYQKMLKDIEESLEK